MSSENGIGANGWIIARNYYLSARDAVICFLLMEFPLRCNTILPQPKHERLYFAARLDTELRPTISLGSLKLEAGQVLLILSGLYQPN